MPKDSSRIRINSGVWKGRYLPDLSVSGVRPTKAFVRERVFAWLGHEVRRAVVYDIFCGTGSLGFEALSRGARYVFSFDRSEEVQAYIARASEHLETKGRFRFHRWCWPEPLPLGKETVREGGADIVFWDPPYQLLDPGEAFVFTVEGGFLKKGGVLYIECARKAALNKTPGFVCLRSGVTGAAFYGLYRRMGEEGSYE